MLVKILVKLIYFGQVNITINEENVINVKKLMKDLGIQDVELEHFDSSQGMFRLLNVNKMINI